MEVTVLAAKWRGLDRRGGRGWGESGGQVACGQPLGVCDGRWGGSGSRGWEKSPQGTVLFDHAAILALAWPVRPLYNVGPLLLLLNCTRHILPHEVSIGCRAVTTRGHWERVLAVADWSAGVWRGISIGTRWTVPSVAEGKRVATCIAQGHGPFPVGLTRTLSLLWGTKRRQTERETGWGSVLKHKIESQKLQEATLHRISGERWMDGISMWPGCFKKTNKKSLSSVFWHNDFLIGSVICTCCTSWFSKWLHSPKSRPLWV